MLRTFETIFKDTSTVYYDILTKGRLLVSENNFSCELLAQLNYHQVRIIGYNDYTLYIDTLLDKLNPN
jgi:hypothetical protein